MTFSPTVGAECFRPNAFTNTPFGVLSGAFNAPLQWTRARFISWLDGNEVGRVFTSESSPQLDSQIDWGTIISTSQPYLADEILSNEASQSFHTGSRPNDFNARSTSTAVRSSLTWNCSRACG